MLQRMGLPIDKFATSTGRSGLKNVTKIGTMNLGSSTHL